MQEGTHKDHRVLSTFHSYSQVSAQSCHYETTVDPAEPGFTPIANQMAQA